MANQQILTGNVLQDGITYHASDLNAAINNAVLLPGAITGRSSVTPTDSHMILVSDGANLRQTTLLQVKGNVMLNNIATTGVANIRQGVSFSGGLAINISGTQNDYAPAGFDRATWLNLTATAPATITGMIAPSSVGALKVISCETGTIVINAQDAGSAAANRFLLGHVLSSITLRSGDLAAFMYFGSRWRMLSFGGFGP